jgi:hypothetical protein
VDELVKRFENGDVSPNQIGKWPDRLNVDETKLVAELVYSQLIIKATIRTRKFEKAIIEGGRTVVYSCARITYAEESLTDYFLPKFLEAWRNEASGATELFDRAAELASVHLDEERRELASREKEKFERQFELVAEISQLATSDWESEELSNERKEIYELDKSIRTTLESTTPPGIREGVAGPKKVPEDEESEENVKRRNRLLNKRAEQTPEEIREKIHTRYEELKNLIDNSEDIREDLNLLEKEEII